MDDISNPQYQLDTVLKWFAWEFNKYSKQVESALKINGGQETDSFYGINQIKEGVLKFESRFQNVNIFSNLLPLILEKLHSDKYLTKKENKYSMTFEGRIFIRANGYKGQLQRESSKQYRKSAGDLILVSGTALTGLYGVFEMSKYLHLSNCYFSIIFLSLTFLFGSIAGAIVWKMLK